MPIVHFHDPERKLSSTLVAVSGTLPAGKVSLRDVLGLVGEQGMLLVSVLLTLPFRYRYRVSARNSDCRSF